MKNFWIIDNADGTQFETLADAKYAIMIGTDNDRDSYNECNILHYNGEELISTVEISSKNGNVKFGKPINCQKRIRTWNSHNDGGSNSHLNVYYTDGTSICCNITAKEAIQVATDKGASLQQLINKYSK